MNEIEHLANVSVGRASFIAMASIAAVMLFTAFDPHLSASIGGFGFLVLSCGLIARAWVSDRIDPRDTEVWGLIASSPRKQQLCRAHVAQAMRLSALRFARDIAGLAAICLSGAVLLALA